MSRISSSHDTTLVLESAVFPAPASRESIFTGHGFSPADFPAVQPRQSEPAWIPAVIITCFILLAWVRVFEMERDDSSGGHPLATR